MKPRDLQPVRRSMVERSCRVSAAVIGSMSKIVCRYGLRAKSDGLLATSPITYSPLDPGTIWKIVCPGARPDSMNSQLPGFSGLLRRNGIGLPKRRCREQSECD